jgi:hypothetical protein
LTIEKRREVGLSAALIGDEYLAASDKKIHVMPLGEVLLSFFPLYRVIRV